MGDVISHKKNIVLPIPEQDDSITLESLMYAKCFCSLKKEDKRTRCSNGCSSEIHETSILGSAPKLFVVCTACNTSSTVYCQTPNELPYCIYLDSFIGDSCGSVTYSLVAIIYRYGSCLSTRLFNCILFNRYCKCILFDYTKFFTRPKMFYAMMKGKNTHISLYTFMKKLFLLSSIPLIILYHGIMILVT